MQRDSLQTVTGLPALIPCELEKAEGFVSRYAPVRALTTKMIVDAVASRTRKTPLGLSAEDWATIHGLKLLLRAYELNDPKAANDASEVLMQTQAFQAAVEHLAVKNLPAFGDQPDTARKRVMQGLSKNTIQEDAGLMATILTFLVAQARPVLWQPGEGKRGKPGRVVLNLGLPQRGMFCADMKTAVVYKMLFSGIRICLRCHSIFSGKPNQDYCSVQCRESHRVARWRERKKVEERRKTKKKGGAK